MLKDIVTIIRNAKCYFSQGTLFCDEIAIDENVKRCIEFLEEQNIVENSGYSNKTGETTYLELSLVRLNSIGYYESLESFIVRNRYSYPSELFFVADGINKFSDETEVLLFSALQGVVNFINSLKDSAKHFYTDVDINYVLIFRDDKSVLFPLIYERQQVEQISTEALKSLALITAVLIDTNTDKRLLFLNELIEYLSPVTEKLRFTTLLRNIPDFTNKCHTAYQYYLRDFSSNKLKIELDSKVLEFTQKIQGVINDSQNKLITIPTAFVLVFATFDYNKVDSAKNIISIISLFIFAVLIQIFLNNQNSSLKFTEANIDSYKDTFSKSNIEKFREKFELVDNEIKKQKNRLLLVTFILWLLPASLLITWLVLGIDNPPPQK